MVRTWLLLSSRGRRYGGGRCQRRGRRRAGDAASWHVLKSFRNRSRHVFFASQQDVCLPTRVSFLIWIFSFHFFKNRVAQYKTHHVSICFTTILHANDGKQQTTRSFYRGLPCLPLCVSWCLPLNATIESSNPFGIRGGNSLCCAEFFWRLSDDVKIGPA